MNQGITLLPPAASAAARSTDRLYLFLVGFSSLMALAIVAVMVWFCYRYRKGSRADRSNAPTHGRGLEAAWTIAPFLVFMYLFAWAAHDYSRQFQAPGDALRVFVLAKQWMWKAEHSNGRREINELHVPINTPIKLVLASQDVIHSFFVPALRNKRDVVPGRYTVMWFQADRTGEYMLLCAEYCGTNHAEMKGRIIAMEPQDYARWLDGGADHPGLAERGYAIFRRNGCMGCHAAASSVHAPELSGLLGRRVHLADGSVVVADETYVRDSMVEPQKAIVAGYDAIMPSFKDQLDEEEIMAVIEYIRSLDTGRLMGERP
ncbi:cytochrome c oxidase subunit II [Pusillimonas noertemannii]|uniref:Cytochrome c oxidase subunit 2 n=1 Tax=Pusillimonas noertemannii TaxID=305977 RepID=A0A2U1CK03_9BURK|nr:cytochrome c oxidase subunit II [Pusillimonas noertemannii]NYT69729.1 cytochrome c oxidase subunit II [Pusillimonas noertemannii]PVY61347.1 cytochrome c oxidase subunit 2 [Pusillimonas noertemannii]TFL09040.1 cytochrome c oxidase subunit II [Pusillimonas noertemannii]